MIGGTGPKKTLRMVAQYGDACNIGDWVGAENMQKALDALKEHCEALGAITTPSKNIPLHRASFRGRYGGEHHQSDQGIAAMGFTHAIFNMPDVYKITPLETFAKEVIPAVAGL